MYLPRAFLVENVVHISTSARKYEVFCLPPDTEYVENIVFSVNEKS